MTTLINQFADLRIRNSADAAFRTAVASGDCAAFQRAVRKSLAKVSRRFNKPLPQYLLVASWSLPELTTERDAELQQQILTVNAGGSAAQLCGFVSAGLKSKATGRSVLQTLVAAELMLRFPAEFTPDAFVDTYATLARYDAGMFSKDSSSDLTEGDDAIQRIVAHGELPFVLSLLLDSLSISKAWLTESKTFIAEALEASTDTDGTLHASLLQNANGWLTPFARITLWAEAFKEPWARKSTLRRWTDCLQRLAATVVPQGFVLTELDSSRTCNSTELLSCISQAGELPDDCVVPAVAKALQQVAARKSRSKSNVKELIRLSAIHAPSAQSDWACSAVLRSSFDPSADLIAIEWEGAQQSLALAAYGTTLFNGIWSSTVTVDDRVVDAVGNWVCTCWFQDDEVAFAELEAGSAGDVRHVRHVMLALKDQFAVITDTAAAGCDDADVMFESRFELSNAFGVEANSITRDVFLKHGDVTVRAIPAWLDDDRVHSTPGDFVAQDDGLSLTARQKGSVCLPLVLDWNSERAKRDADWNRLTVTEQGRVNSPFESCGFRVRVADLQLLIYRSLRQGDSNRCVLGHHTANESVYAHVRKTGLISRLVLVESEA